MNKAKVLAEEFSPFTDMVFEKHYYKLVRLREVLLKEKIPIELVNAALRAHFWYKTEVRLWELL